MSFQIDCPQCGRRPVGEFHFGGPVRPRPDPAADDRTWTGYLYNRPNLAGDQNEWWYHRAACKLWFVARRDTRTNHVQGARRFEPQEGAGG